MITYKDTTLGRKAVLLNGRRVGTIVPVVQQGQPKRWKYVAGGKYNSFPCDSLDACKRSIEGRK